MNKLNLDKNFFSTVHQAQNYDELKSEGKSKTDGVRTPFCHQNNNEFIDFLLCDRQEGTTVI